MFPLTPFGKKPPEVALPRRVCQVQDLARSAKRGKSRCRVYREEIGSRWRRNDIDAIECGCRDLQPGNLQTDVCNVLRFGGQNSSCCADVRAASHLGELSCPTVSGDADIFEYPRQGQELQLIRESDTERVQGNCGFRDGLPLHCRRC